MGRTPDGIVVVIGLGIFLLIASLISLIVVGVVVVSPYLEVKDWKQAVCTVTKTSKYQLDYGELRDVVPKYFVPCVSDHTADTLYEEDIYLTPCTDIAVVYTHPTHGSTKATLYSDFDAIGQDTWNVTCSKIVCQDDEFEEAAGYEADFTSKYSVRGTEHDCYYSEIDRGKAIAWRYGQTEALVGMLIPATFFVLSLVMVIVGVVLMKQRSAN